MTADEAEAILVTVMVMGVHPDSPNARDVKAWIARKRAGQKMAGLWDARPFLAGWADYIERQGLRVGDRKWEWQEEMGPYTNVTVHYHDPGPPK